MGNYMRRLVFVGFAVIFMASIGVVSTFPQVPHLILEGFPAQVMGNTANLVRVDGAQQGEPLSFSTPSDASQSRFYDAQGTALLVDQANFAPVGIYGEGIDANMRLNSYSMVKTLVGLLVVRAVERGDLPSLNTSVQDILGHEAPNIEIAELLTMSGGLAATSESVKRERDEGYSPFSVLGQMHIYGVEDVYEDLEIRADWVGGFHYQSANTALLGRILEVAYETPLAELLSEIIWQPAGAADAYWRAYPHGDGITAYCCLYARPQDWLHVGRFILENGTEDTPLFSPAVWRDWILPSLSAQARGNGAYGDHVRHDVLDRDGAPIHAPFAYAMGHLGQVMYLVPDLDAVVVRFGSEPQLLHSTLYELLEPLPED